MGSNATDSETSLTHTHTSFSVGTSATGARPAHPCTIPYLQALYIDPRSLTRVAAMNRFLKKVSANFETPASSTSSAGAAPVGCYSGGEQSAARGDAVPHTDADARPEYCAKAADSLSESGQVGHGAQSDPTTSLSSAAKLTLPADRVVPTTALTVRRGPLLPGSARLTALPTHRQRGLPLGSAAWSGNGRTCRVDVAGRSRLAPPTAVPLDGDDGALLGPFARIKQRDSLSLSSSDEDDARETTRRPARSRPVPRAVSPWRRSGGGRIIRDDSTRSENMNLLAPPATLSSKVDGLTRTLAEADAATAASAQRGRRAPDCAEAHVAEAGACLRGVSRANSAGAQLDATGAPGVALGTPPQNAATSASATQRQLGEMRRMRDCFAASNERLRALQASQAAAAARPLPGRQLV